MVNMRPSTKLKMKKMLLPIDFMCTPKQSRFPVPSILCFCESSLGLWEVDFRPPVVHFWSPRVISQKNVLSLKNTLLSCPYFVIKTYILTKTVLSCSFFHVFHEKLPRCHAYIWSKNVNSVETILWGIIVNRISFLYDFSPKNSLLLCPSLVKKTSIL